MRLSLSLSLSPKGKKKSPRSSLRSQAGWYFCKPTRDSPLDKRVSSRLHTEFVSLCEWSSLIHYLTSSWWATIEIRYDHISRHRMANLCIMIFKFKACAGCYSVPRRFNWWPGIPPPRVQMGVCPMKDQQPPENCSTSVLSVSLCSLHQQSRATCKKTLIKASLTTMF